MPVIPPYFSKTLERNPADFTLPKPSVTKRVLDAFTLPAEYLKALDVAKYQEIYEVDYPTAYASGYRLVIIKATQGNSSLDPMFEWHWQHALDAGFYIMLYHFFMDNIDGKQQADWFLTQTRQCREAIKDKTAAWLDIERNAGNASTSLSTRRSRAQAWCLNLGFNIPQSGVYSSPALWQELMGNDSLYKYGDGWVAHWTGAKTPTLPVGWTEADTRVWQTGVYPTYSSWVEPVPGVLGTVDVDRWFGNEQTLRDYLGYSDTKPTVEETLADHERRITALEQGR